ncbi:MAG: hypothetical protein AAF892_11470 [Cyanobacteria bacterium P01_D01_bin.71]
MDSRSVFAGAESMTSEEAQPKRRTLSDLVYAFLLGIAFGLVFAMLPAMFISLSTLEWHVSYIVALGLLSLLSGVASAVFGKSFLKPLIWLIESVPTVV